MDKALWLTAACTDLGVEDLKGMVVPDWLQLQGRLGDFLQKPASSFRSGI